MKKTARYAALLNFIIPMVGYTMGFGDMEVHSSLDQPFKAEIALIDTRNIIPSLIKVSVATADDYAEAGLVSDPSLPSLFQFQVVKNAQGRDVILITSQERIIDPFMDILLDIAWPGGQMFKEFIVLLDPPGYTLSNSSATFIRASYSSPVRKTPIINDTAIDAKPSETTHTFTEERIIKPGNITTDSTPHIATANNQSGKITYGPVVSGETIWQIAQHYKIPELKLSQMVLAIVGMNPTAFTDGNLNGLKPGAQLIIPTPQTVTQVPATLSEQEIAAHDSAWRERTPIKHVLTPPYYIPTAQAEENQTTPTLTKPKVKASPELLQFPDFITKVGNTFNEADSEPQLNENPTLPSSLPTINISPTSSLPIQSADTLEMNKADSLLKTQIQQLKTQNDNLQQQLSKRDKDLTEIKEQLQILLKSRQAVAGQAVAVEQKSGFSTLILYFLLLLAAALGIFYALWRLNKPLPEVIQKNMDHWLKNKKNMDEMSTETDIANPVPTPIPPPKEIEITSESKVEAGENIAAAASKSIEPELKEFSEDPSIPEEKLNTADSSQPNENTKAELINFGEELFEEPELIIESEDDSSQELKNAEFFPNETEILNEKQKDITKFEASPSDDTQNNLQLDSNVKGAEIEQLPIDTANSDTQSEEYLIEFEPGLYSATEKAPEKVVKVKVDDPNSPPPLEFNLDPIEPKTEENKIETPKENAISSNINDISSPSNVPIKSYQALETLLALSKTYISMGDKEAAKQTLTEVLEYGNEEQQKIAKGILDDLE